MSPDDFYARLRDAISSRLEAIVDPCSAASGAPAGLVSMGLIKEVVIEQRTAGAHVHVTLCITEPGCLMGALFQLTAERQLAELPGVANVEVHIDHGHVWGPERMTPEYRRRLADVRARRAAHMKATSFLPERNGGDN
jgi:metal-sulfur cluster biosynthetic enzyme